MNDDYTEVILKNKNKIIELERTVYELGGELYKKELDTNQLNPPSVIEDQNKYINLLNMEIDKLLQGKGIEYKRKIEEILSSNKYNKSFYQLYNMGAIYLNDKYYTISNIFIKEYRSKDNLDKVYQILSTKNKDLSIFSKDVDISNYTYCNLYKFKDYSLFIKLYSNKQMCNGLIIDLNSDLNKSAFLEYLNNFDGNKYDFIKELSFIDQ